MAQKTNHNSTGHYIEHLSKDAKLKKLLLSQEARSLKKKDNLPLSLYTTIINQQLSNKVGAVFYKRFLDLYKGEPPTSQQVIDTPFEVLRSIGLSNAKATYIKNVAQFDIDLGLNKKVFGKMTDEEAIKYLTSIKGIGKWTAHIFLMSALAREDVFPADDLIIQKAMAALYKLDKTDKKKFHADMQRISAKWSPYRSYASLHLWRMEF